MKKTHNTSFPEFIKKAAKIKINKRLDAIDDAPFFKEKMERGEKILAVAGLPKLK